MRTPRKTKKTTFKHVSGVGQFVLDSSPRGIKELGRVIRAWRVDYLEQSWTEIARCAGVCGTTIKNLETGKTKSPHFNSVMSILYALGFSTTATHESHVSRRAEMRRAA